jgi:hypothetical protein
MLTHDGLAVSKSRLVKFIRSLESPASNRKTDTGAVNSVCVMAGEHFG